MWRACVGSWPSSAPVLRRITNAPVTMTGALVVFAYSRCSCSAAGAGGVFLGG